MDKRGEECGELDVSCQRFKYNAARLDVHVEAGHNSQA
jgi:hypothetical protein